MTLSRKCFLPVKAGAESHTWLWFRCEGKMYGSMNARLYQGICAARYRNIYVL